MDNERPNERTLWSRRLEEPGALPGLTDKEATWDRLYDRLKKTTPPHRSRKMIWLWAAAACVLLLLIPAALLLKDRHRSIHSDPEKLPVAVTGSRQAHPSPLIAIPDSQLTARSSPLPAIPDSQLAARSSPLFLARSSQLPAPRSPLNSHPSPLAASLRPGSRVIPDRRHPGLDKLPVRDADTPTIISALRPGLPKLTTVLAAAPPKKELRVVHINELDPSQPTPATVKGPREKPGGLHIGLTPQETFRPSTTYTGPEAHSILTLKHTQNP